MTVFEELGREFAALKIVLKDCDQMDADAASVMHGRLSIVSRKLMQIHAATEADLVLKARVLLEWVNPDGDWIDDFAGHLCRDILRLYAGEENG